MLRQLREKEVRGVWDAANGAADGNADTAEGDPDVSAPHVQWFGGGADGGNEGGGGGYEGDGAAGRATHGVQDDGASVDFLNRSLGPPCFLLAAAGACAGPISSPASDGCGVGTFWVRARVQAGSSTNQTRRLTTTTPPWAWRRRATHPTRPPTRLPTQSIPTYPPTYPRAPGPEVPLLRRRRSSTTTTRRLLTPCARCGF